MAFLEQSQALWQLLASVIEDEGFLLYDAEVLTSASLRLSIAAPKVHVGDAVAADEVAEEAAEKDPSKTNAGVSSGDCSRILRRLMVVLQAEGRALGVSAEPEIEVASPGVNRVLRRPEHFTEALGERVKIVLRPSRELDVDNGKKCATLIGTLEQFSEGRVSVLDESMQKSFAVPISDIKRAQIEFQF